MTYIVMATPLQSQKPTNQKRYSYAHSQFLRHLLLLGVLADEHLARVSVGHQLHCRKSREPVSLIPSLDSTALPAHAAFMP